MFTQCPHCSLSFGITAEVLKQAAGKVRCGGCREVFNALEYLTEDRPDAAARDTGRSKPPERRAEPDDDPVAAPPPEAMSPEQGKALRESLERLTDENVELEDTGVEWRLLDTGNREAVEPDGESPAVDDATTVIGDFESTVAQEVRFDDNTGLPEGFDHDAPSVPVVQPGSHARADELAYTDTQVDIAFGDPEEWSELLGEVVAAAQTVDSPEPPSLPVEDPNARAGEPAAEDDELERAFAEMHSLLEDADPESSSEIGAELEETKRDLVDSTIEEDLIAAAFGTEEAISDQLAMTTDVEPRSAGEDRLGDSVVLDLDSLDSGDDLTIEMDLLAANEDDETSAEPMFIDEFANEPAGDTSILEELDEAMEIISDDGPSTDVPAPTDEELTVNQLIDQELLSIAYEDEDGMTSTIIMDGDAAREAIEAQAAEEERQGDGEPEPADARDEAGTPDEAGGNVGIETIVMEGTAEHALSDLADAGIEIEFGDEADPEIEALKEKVRARDEARLASEAKAARSGERRRLGGGIVALTLLLALQGVHFSRATLATMPGIGDTITAVYRSIGRPVTPDWDVTGWVFEAQTNSTDPRAFRRALGLEAAEIAAEPDADDILTIYTRIGNHSPDALPYPLVAVSLTDRFEETIGSVVLEPEQYLPGGAGRGAVVPGGDSFDAIMSIDTPNPAATGFRLNICYRQADRRLRCAIEDFK